MQNLLRILIVEDDYLIAEMVRDALSDGGFEPEVVGSGQEALHLLDDGGTYCALVTDINLRGDYTGWQVAQRARELSTDLPVIYMTGAAADEWASRGVPNSVLLNKPFAPAQVVTAVSKLLNHTTPPND
ncbi:transcriptional regulator [Bradyrhizobium sp. CCBAU 11434]|uniref:response regulator n=1 Tax=Bradyrhizobium sp. CCBAU 11434 TaxID=1630885 RepID=UPI002FE01414|nr:transcriptional regulator [Bradyrhizobium sp. CCBAU 11434]